MRIGLFADPATGNAHYRAILPLTVLHAKGHDVRPLSPDPRRRRVEVRELDLLHVHRFDDGDVHALMREAKQHGAAVVWDNDDDYGSLPKTSLAYRRHGGLAWERRLARMRRIFPLVDVVTTPSDLLGARMREYGARRTATIENYVPGLFLRHATPPRNGVTIGWVAALEHQVDVELLPIRETLQRLLDERPELHVVSIGLSLGLTGERYRHVKKVPFLEDEKERTVAAQARSRVKLDALASGGLANHTAAFDVGIAPLADLPFNRARSNVKLKEYAAGGAPWLASPVGPYLGMGERQGGRLVADDAWHAELSKLLDSARARRKLAKRATAWVADETIERNVHRWEAVLAEAVERSRAR